MRIIGVVGGLSPVATEVYYKKLTYGRDEEFPDYPEVIIDSLNQEGLNTFVQLARYDKHFEEMKNNGYKKPIRILREAVDVLNNAGADFGLISSNTPHLLFNEVNEESKLPLIDLIEEVAKKVEEKGFRKVGLLGTRLVMNEGFYQETFSNHSLEIRTPRKEEQDLIQQKLGDELVYGKVDKETDRRFVEIVKRMKEEQDIEAIILGCTDLPFLPSLNEENLGLPTLDTVEIHCEAALRKSV